MEEMVGLDICVFINDGFQGSCLFIVYFSFGMSFLNGVRDIWLCLVILRRVNLFWDGVCGGDIIEVLVIFIFFIVRKVVIM